MVEVSDRMGIVLKKPDFRVVVFADEDTEVSSVVLGSMVVLLGVVVGPKNNFNRHEKENKFSVIKQMENGKTKALVSGLC